ncbi:hypothetical protein N0B44_26515 [Roseibacterium beibuensis]|nr:hypothetical protein [Roseibacterium beibuensis]
MIRVLREVLLIVAVAGLLPLVLEMLIILGSYAAGMERGYELWFLLVVVTTAFFPLAGTSGLARLTAACLERTQSWRLTGAIGGGLMLALLLVGLLLQQRREDYGAVLSIGGCVVLAAGASILLTLANNWFDRRRDRQR